MSEVEVEGGATLNRDKRTCGAGGNCNGFKYLQHPRV